MNTTRTFASLSLTAIIGTIAVAAPIYAKEADDRVEIVKQARAALDAKNWEEAEKLYTKAIVLDRKEATAWFSRGYVRGNRNNYDGAIADTSSGLVALALSGKSTAHNRAVGFANRASYWFKKGEFRRALVDSIVACKVDETFLSAWLNRADAQYALGNLEQANICLEKIRSNKGSVTRDFTTEGARQNALKNKPLDEKADITALFNVAYKDKSNLHTADAIKGFTEVIEKNPTVTNAWLNRAEIYKDAKRFDEALADYAMAISLASLGKNREDQSNSLASRAYIYLLELKRYAEAVNDAELAVKLNPENKYAVTALKDARDRYLKDPATPKATDTQLAEERVVRLKEREAERRERRKTGKGIKILGGNTVEDQVKRDIGLGIADAESYLDRADSYMQLFQAFKVREYPDLALADVEKALSLRPDYAAALDLRGQLHARKEERLEALSDFNAAVNLERATRGKSGITKLPADAEYDPFVDLLALGIKDPLAKYLVDRGLTLADFGKLTPALADFVEAGTLEPGIAEFAFYEAKALMELKRYDDAIAACDRALKLKPSYKQAQELHDIVVKKKTETRK